MAQRSTRAPFCVEMRPARSAPKDRLASALFVAPRKASTTRSSGGATQSASINASRPHENQAESTERLSPLAVSLLSQHSNSPTLDSLSDAQLNCSIQLHTPESSARWPGGASFSSVSSEDEHCTVGAVSRRTLTLCNGSGDQLIGPIPTRIPLAPSVHSIKMDGLDSPTITTGMERDPLPAVVPSLGRSCSSLGIQREHPGSVTRWSAPLSLSLAQFPISLSPDFSLAQFPISLSKSTPAGPRHALRPLEASVRSSACRSPLIRRTVAPNTRPARSRRRRSTRTTLMPLFDDTADRVLTRREFFS